MSLGDEVQDMDWMVSVVQSGIKDVRICIDSPNYLAIEKAIQVYKGAGRVFINSITGEDERMKKILPLAVKANADVIALTMDDAGMPNTAEDRRDMAKKILSKTREAGLPDENLYFDPLIRPVSTEPDQAKEFLRSIPMIKDLGRVKTVCGLSNVSYGLPNRKLINSAFLTMAIQAGLDAAILDPTDKRMMSNVAAAGALLGTDEYCTSYIQAFRAGRLL
jgi:5-methyltetrahydrofolate--homocysteine methyltransferase